MLLVYKITIGPVTKETTIGIKSNNPDDIVNAMLEDCGLAPKGVDTYTVARVDGVIVKIVGFLEAEKAYFWMEVV